MADHEKGVTLTDTGNNNKVKLKLKKGDGLTLKLEAEPGTGFSWHVVLVNDEQLKQQGASEFLAPAKQRAGSTETQVLRFSAHQAGSSELELHYKRSFEATKGPAKIFKASVQIG